MITVLLTVAFAVVAVVHFGTMALAAQRLWAARQPRRLVADGPPVSVIRPVCGLENHLEETLASGFRLDYPDYEMVFCFEDTGDPAIPLARGLIAAHPDVPARLLIGDDRISINPKLNNVVKGYRAARHDHIMMVDSNVLMPRDSVRWVIGEWTAKTGAVSAPATGSEPEGAGGELECAFLNTCQARWLMAADRLGLGYVQGKMMLFRRSELEGAGGIAALAAEVAEDSGLTKAMRRNGLEVRMTGCQFLHPVGRRRFAEVWQRQLRWAKLRRTCFPFIYAGEVVGCAAVPVALLAGLAISAGFSPAWAGLLLVGLYAGEAIVAVAAGWRLTVASPAYWFLRDLLQPVIWLLGWHRGAFVWRGHGMQVDEEGRAPERTRRTAVGHRAFE